MSYRFHWMSPCPKFSSIHLCNHTPMCQSSGQRRPTFWITLNCLWFVLENRTYHEIVVFTTFKQVIPYLSQYHEYLYAFLLIKRKIGYKAFYHHQIIDSTDFRNNLGIIPHTGAVNSQQHRINVYFTSLKYQVAVLRALPDVHISPYFKVVHHIMVRKVRTKMNQVDISWAFDKEKYCPRRRQNIYIFWQICQFKTTIFFRKTAF